MLHDSAPRAEEPDFHRIHVQVENVRKLLDRKSFNFLEQKQLPVLLRQFLEHPFQKLSYLGPGAGRFRRAALRNDAVEPRHLLLGKVRLINQGPHLLLSEVIPAFVHGNLVEPGRKRGPLIEALERQERLEEYLLSDVLDVLPAAQNSAHQGENALLVPANQLFKGGLATALGSPDKVPVLFGPAPPDQRRRDCCGLCCHAFWDVTHAVSVSTRFLK